MTTPSWDNNLSSEGPPMRRKKLQLKPRSVQPNETANRYPSSGKSNPFGAAKPREQVLAEKGIDFKLMDERIAEKTAVVHFTKDQELELESIRAELTKLEADWRSANEKELPEEALRVQVESKRTELNQMVAKFTKENQDRKPRRSLREDSSGDGVHSSFGGGRRRHSNSGE